MKLLERLDILGKVGPRPTGSPADKEGKNLVIQWMLEEGLSVTMDDFNNIIGRLDGEGDPIVTGSHTDTVATAGKYDGALGVLAGLEAVSALRCDHKSPLEVVIFNDEENTMSGSIGYTANNPHLKAFIELHVEQGPVLDTSHVDVGIVQGIVGQRRCHVTLLGTENHAGTTPMNMRDDALVKAASLVTYVNDYANEMFDGLVATVGELTVSPNAFSVIPGQVDLTLQVRDLDVDNMEKFVDQISKEFDLRIDFAHTSEPALCDQGIMDHIEGACYHLGLKSTYLPSRASHDAQNFTYCPMGMIFVPSVGGVSHSPHELTTDDQCLNGARVLTEVIRRIDGV